MKRGNGWLGAFVACGGASVIALAAACGDDNSEFNGGSTSGTSGVGTSSGTNSSSFGGTSGDGTSGGGTSSGASGTTASSGFNPDASCASTNVGAERTPANILFIVDRSRSMRCASTTATATCESFPEWPGGDAASATAKWNITKAALKNVIANMPATNSAGITYFNVGNSQATECNVTDTPNVPVQPISPDQLALVNSSLDNSGTLPDGLTPIVGGVTNGYAHLHTTSSFTGKKILVLITDGAETCANHDAPTMTNFMEKTIADARSVGITTFVIGAPGSEGARAFLSQIAFKGGSARSADCIHTASPNDQGDCHFDLTQAGADLSTQLNAALDTISKRSLGCEFDVPSGSGPIDYNKVNVIYTPSGGAAQTVAQDTKACDAANGWQYSPDRKRITLCGDICNTVKADTNGAVSIALGCVTYTGPK